MNGDLKESLNTGAAQIHCGVYQAVIHLLELGHHIQNHIGQVEGNMRNQQSPEGQAVALAQKPGTDKDEQQGQGYTGNNIRIRHGDIGQIHGHLA